MKKIKSLFLRRVVAVLIFPICWLWCAVMSVTFIGTGVAVDEFQGWWRRG